MKKAWVINANPLFYSKTLAWKSVESNEDLKKIGIERLNNNQIIVKPSNREYISGYVAVKDLNGNHGFILQVNMPREIYQHGQKTLAYYIFTIIAAGLAFSVLIILIIEKTILNPLRYKNRDKGQQLSSKIC